MQLIAKITQAFKDEVKSLMNFNTPATTHKGILHKPKNNRYKKNKDIHNLYRSGVGSLIKHLIHSQPQLSNALRDV